MYISATLDKVIATQPLSGRHSARCRPAVFFAAEGSFDRCVSRCYGVREPYPLVAEQFGQDPQHMPDARDGRR